MLKKFQDFAIKGNAFDLAVGVIIGAAFGGIVASLVGDIFMPVVGAVTGGLDFSNYFVPLSSKVTADTLVEAKKQGAVLAWGNFLTIVINFLIVAAVMFGLVNLIQRLRQKEEAKPAGRAAAPGGIADRNPRPAGEAIARISGGSIRVVARASRRCARAVSGCRRGKIRRQHATARYRNARARLAYLRAMQATCSCVFARMADRERMAHEQHLNGTEIFVVDDDETMRDTLSAVFTPEGCRVTCFAEGQSFLVAARARTPACILLDVNMPGRSGLDMLRELDAPHYPAPILIVSGQRDVPTAVNAIKGGALDFIEKPIEAAAVVARVREAILALAAPAGNGDAPGAGRGQGRRAADAARARGAGAGHRRRLQQGGRPHARHQPAHRRGASRPHHGQARRQERRRPGADRAAGRRPRH